MKYIIIAMTLMLTACAEPPKFLANSYDRNDPCQSRAELNRPKDYKIPDFCGASGPLRTTKNSRMIYDKNNNYIGIIK